MKKVHLTPAGIEVGGENGHGDHGQDETGHEQHLESQRTVAQGRSEASRGALENGQQANAAKREGHDWRGDAKPRWNVVRRKISTNKHFALEQGIEQLRMVRHVLEGLGELPDRIAPKVRPSGVKNENARPCEQARGGQDATPFPSIDGVQQIQ